ncbi:hypothetical protein BDW60DRAFT_27783 [Aspergillus nidulans var. acristatus]|jgi:hypothetical protein
MAKQVTILKTLAEQWKLNQAEEIYRWDYLSAGSAGQDALSNPQVLCILYSLSILYKAQRKWKNMMATYEQALSGHIALGSNQVIVPRYVEPRAYLHHIDLKKSEDMCQRSRSEYHDMFRPDHILTLKSPGHLEACAPAVGG